MNSFSFVKTLKEPIPSDFVHNYIHNLENKTKRPLEINKNKQYF